MTSFSYFGYVFIYFFQICWRMNGIRFISCKSAKDRTSMSVTLEQCSILKRKHNLQPEIFNHAIDAMRR